MLYGPTKVVEEDLQAEEIEGHVSDVATGEVDCDGQAGHVIDVPDNDAFSCNGDGCGEVGDVKIDKRGSLFCAGEINGGSSTVDDEWGC